MELEYAKQVCKNYYAIVEHARRILPEDSTETFIRQASWLYVQYGCNTYTDGPGFPFQPEDVQDALPVNRQEGKEIAERLVTLGVLERLHSGRCRFPAQWV